MHTVQRPVHNWKEWFLQQTSRQCNRICIHLLSLLRPSPPSFDFYPTFRLVYVVCISPSLVVFRMDIPSHPWQLPHLIHIGDAALQARYMTYDSPFFLDFYGNIHIGDHQHFSRRSFDHVYDVPHGAPNVPVPMVALRLFPHHVRSFCFQLFNCVAILCTMYRFAAYLRSCSLLLSLSPIWLPSFVHLPFHSTFVFLLFLAYDSLLHYLICNNKVVRNKFFLLPTTRAFTIIY